MMDNLDILYHGDARLADWGETRAGGKYIKLFLDDSNEDPLINFRGLDIGELKKSGHLFNLTISTGELLPIESDISEPVAPKPRDIEKPYGNFAAKLYIDGFFFCGEVLQVLGDKEKYSQWIRNQPSCLSGEFSKNEKGEKQTMAIMVSLSAEQETTLAQNYAYIPLTVKEYVDDNVTGENGAMPYKQQMSKRNKYVVLWAKERLCYLLGYPSLGAVSPNILLQWCVGKNISKYLPKEYRNE